MRAKIRVMTGLQTEAYRYSIQYASSSLDYAKTCQVCKLVFSTELMDRNCCAECIALMKRLRADGRLSDRWKGFYLT